jgi:hypothetical protein
MKILADIEDLFRRSFVLLRHNMVLSLPFLAFWLLIGFVLVSLSGGGERLFSLVLLLGIMSAFTSGWFNMFKKCVETPLNENLPEDELTEDSFSLFKEFFPGVGKYFVRIAVGLTLFLLVFNVLMLGIETLALHFLGGFESFRPEEMIKAMNQPSFMPDFWKNINDTDKSRIISIAALEVGFTVLLAYLAMFWAQFVVLKDISPLKGFLKSIITTVKDFLRTFPIFVLNTLLLAGVFVISAVLGVNPLIRLVMILLFVYALVFHILMTFLYVERHSS